MKHANKILLVFLVNLTLSAPIYAEIVKQKRLNFKFNSEKLMKGDIHYSYKLFSPQQLKEKFPRMAELDTVKALRKAEDTIIVSKTVYVVNKPIGFFDHKQMIDPKFLNHYLGDQKLTMLTENALKVDVTGKKANKYIMKIYFDSDDISTLPDSKAIRAVGAAKKMDVLSLSASAILLKEFTNYDRFQRGTVMVTSFIPLKENKTLTINYYLSAIRKESVSIGLEELLLSEVATQKKLIESYQP